MTVKAWRPAFLIAGIACLVAAALGLMLKAPKHRSQPRSA
jgi:hypothetical protein